MTKLTIPAAGGGSFSAYVAVPAKTPAPAIIVIQEIFGINGEMRDKCDELAAQGYLAICPDLFWRIEPGIELVDSIPEQLQRAFDLFGQFDVNKGLEDLKATLSTVQEDKRCNGKVGCIGFCLGGKLAYMMAARSDVDASVSYYGVGIEGMLNDAKTIQKPLLMHIAEEDQFVSKDAQSAIKAALKNLSQIKIYSYPGVEHAFARGKGMHYNEQAATLAARRTADFLGSALR